MWWFEDDKPEVAPWQLFIEQHKPVKYGLLLLAMIAVNYTCYQILDNLLKRHSMNYKIIEYHHKRYVVKNLTKSMILLMLLVGGAPGLIDLVFNGNWSNEIAHTMGTIYLSTDVSGLLFVPRLPTETLIHHTCVVILGTINIFVDYKVNGLHRAFISLTLLSMIPYLVNTYLGMRYLEGASIKRWIVGICMWVYSASVVVNCFLQHLYVFWLVPGYWGSWTIFKKVCYLAIYYFILNDDIKLIRYLKFKYEESRTARLAKKGSLYKDKLVDFNESESEAE